MRKESPARWLSESPFNLLVDYYTEVPSRPYGSGATAKNVIPVLRDLKPGCIVVYAKGHSGYTTFPSSLRTEHVMLAKDMPVFFRAATRRTGVRLILYYSGLLDGIAALRHPDWVMRDGDGVPMRSFTEFRDLFHAAPLCPLSPYFDEWVSVHLRELVERADPDGFWVDGDWPGPCWCDRCRARYEKETGFSAARRPDDPASPEGAAWARTWAGIMHGWRTRFNAFIKNLKPDCLYSAGNVTARREYSGPFDWRSGDWFSPNNHRLQQSISMRRYTVLGLPCDAYTCDTVFVHSRPHLRPRTKTLSRMLQEGAGVLANGGLWGYWTYPMPNGAFVPSRMRRARAAAAFARERAAVCLGTASARWTAVLETDPYALTGYNAPVCGAAKALIHCHRSPDIIDESDLAGAVPYELIVIPEQAVPDNGKTVGRLERFAENGGWIIGSGAAIRSPGYRALLGAKLLRQGALDDGHVFLASGDPAGVFAPWDRLEPAGAGELYPLHLSWDQFNPEVRRIPANYAITGMVDEENPEKSGMPAALARAVGKGGIIHIATEIFRDYWTYGNPDVLAWIREILSTAQPDPWFSTDALPFVEVVLRTKDGALLVHMVNGNPGRDTSHVGTNDLWVDDIPPVGPIACRIRCGARPAAVRVEPGGHPVEWSWDGTVCSVVLPRLEVHACIVVDGWNEPLPRRAEKGSMRGRPPRGRKAA